MINYLIDMFLMIFEHFILISSLYSQSLINFVPSLNDSLLSILIEYIYLTSYKQANTFWIIRHNILWKEGAIIFGYI
jgi:hypothetical protein